MSKTINSTFSGVGFGFGSSGFAVPVLSITVLVLKRSFIFLSGLFLIRSLVSETIFLSNSAELTPSVLPVVIF